MQPNPPYSGRCLCGATEYRVTAEPLALYACHCTDCQKRSGSAFGLSMWVPRSAIEVTKGEAVLNTTTTAEGRPVVSRICPRCVTRLWSEPRKRPEIAVLRPGTLDDRSWVRPVAHIWTRSAQPWFVFPEGVAKFAQQPEDPRQLIELWRNRADRAS